MNSLRSAASRSGGIGSRGGRVLSLLKLLRWERGRLDRRTKPSLPCGGVRATTRSHRCSDRCRLADIKWLGASLSAGSSLMGVGREIVANSPGTSAARGALPSRAILAEMDATRFGNDNRGLTFQPGLCCSNRLPAERHYEIRLAFGMAQGSWPREVH